MTLTRLPSTKALVAFEAAARLRSFKKAASELAVTPGAISQQIRALEEGLGCALFKREARTVSLTNNGELLSKSVSESFQNIQSTLNKITSQGQPKLRINTNPAIVAKLLLPRINGFSDRFPNLEIQIETQLSLNEMEHGGPDVAIRTTSAPPTELHHLLLHTELLVPVVSPEFVKRHDLIRPDDMGRVPLLHDISLSQFKGTPGWDEWFEQAGLTGPLHPAKIHFEDSAADFLVDMAIAGSGVLLGRSSLVYDALSRGQLCCPFGPVLQTNIGIYALCRQERRADPGVRAFFGWLKEEFALLSTINALNSALV